MRIPAQAAVLAAAVAVAGRLAMQSTAESLEDRRSGVAVVVDSAVVVVVVVAAVAQTDQEKLLRRELDSA
jgi:hypothetical protein